MTRSEIIRARLRMREILDSEESSEAGKFAAEMALRNLPPVPKDFLELSQPKEA